jgi:hypothetical protein
MTLFDIVCSVKFEIENVFSYERWIVAPLGISWWSDGVRGRIDWSVRRKESKY